MPSKLAAIFELILLDLVVKNSGGPALRHLIHSEDFFPWPVTALFFVESRAPWLAGTGFVGAAVGYVLRALLFRDSEQTTAEVVSVRRTGTKINGLPRVRLVLRTRTQDIVVKTLIAFRDMPSPGDPVWAQVSRADPSAGRYVGLVTD